MAFPLRDDAPPTITGGLGGNENSKPRELVSLAFEPYNVRGAIRGTVHLETENWNPRERSLHSETTIRFLVSYADLARFGPEMLDVINGNAEDAVLSSNS